MYTPTRPEYTVGDSSKLNHACNLSSLKLLALLGNGLCNAVFDAQSIAIFCCILSSPIGDTRTASRISEAFHQISLI